MTDKEVIQMALDALNNFDKGNHGMRWQAPVIKALRAALAQPKPAECDGGQCGIGGYCKQCPKTQPEHPDAQGSPCPEFWNWLPKAYGQTESFSKYNMEVAYLAGKQSQPEPEPVAVVGLDMSEVNVYYGSQYCGKKQETKIAVFLKDVLIGTRLYTAPPQREWVGLTDEEIESIYAASKDVNYEYERSIEAKLKEKNT